MESRELTYDETAPAEWSQPDLDTRAEVQGYDAGTSTAGPSDTTAGTTRPATEPSKARSPTDGTIPDHLD